MASVEVSAPGMSSCPGRRSVSGSTRGAASTIAMPIGRWMKNPTRQESHPAKMPPSTSPTVSPTPATAA
jgi:hypothetical protein